MRKGINLNLYGFYEWGSKDLNFCLLKDSGIKITVFICVQFSHMSKNELILSMVCFLSSLSSAAFWSPWVSVTGLRSAGPGLHTLPCSKHWFLPAGSILRLWLFSDPLPHLGTSAFISPDPKDQAYPLLLPLIYPVTISHSLQSPP